MVFSSIFNPKTYFSGRGCLPFRIAVAICVSMAGVGDKVILLSGGTGFLATSSFSFFCLLWLDLYLYCDIFHDCRNILRNTGNGF